MPAWRRRLTWHYLRNAPKNLKRRLMIFQAERQALRWDVKVMGYHLARQMAEALPPVPPGAAPRIVGLGSKGCVQEDIESDWFTYWCRRLETAPIYHRKIWEFCYILQALHDAGALRPGATAIGFGCGTEPLPSLFAALGITVLATDAPPALAGSGWTETGQHMASLDILHKPELCDRPTFDRLVSLRYVDMNRIPADLADGFDFAWSACALEHLGDIANGLRFIEESLACLKPGGVAVHTTEWNFGNEDSTVEDGPTVLFQRRHFEAVAARLVARGFQVAPLDFSLGSGVLDQFVDVPPYSWDRSNLFQAVLGRGREAHLRLMVDGYPATSFGLIVRKPPAS